MPLYEYTCSQRGCELRDEVVAIMKSIHDAKQPERCACGTPMHRVMSSPAGHVKNGTPKFHNRS